ncbi:hypothetical protein KUV65_13840 [Maritalea mobilis]|uniref:hypothetical protein n=1 Tax=Maritalea mobilis TaxID=483324 RepID=UPI001C96A6B9|nr:hypothetical protein [Maritalea mobilis]MBY6202456.1 hypothetical protein [Maritalea mobilis]
MREPLLGFRSGFVRSVVGALGKMPSNKIEHQALRLLSAFERAGKQVSRVTIDGRKIELVLASGEDADEFDRIDMRHGQA